MRFWMPKSEVLRVFCKLDPSRSSYYELNEVSSSFFLGIFMYFLCFPYVLFLQDNARALSLSLSCIFRALPE